MMKYTSKFSFEIKKVMLKNIISVHGAGKLLVDHNYIGQDKKMVNSKPD